MQKNGIIKSEKRMDGPQHQEHTQTDQNIELSWYHLIPWEVFRGSWNVLVEYQAWDALHEYIKLIHPTKKEDEALAMIESIKTQQLGVKDCENLMERLIWQNYNMIEGPAKREDDRSKSENISTQKGQKGEDEEGMDHFIEVTAMTNAQEKQVRSVFQLNSVLKKVCQTKTPENNTKTIQKEQETMIVGQISQCAKQLIGCHEIRYNKNMWSMTKSGKLENNQYTVQPTWKMKQKILYGPFLESQEDKRSLIYISIKIGETNIKINSDTNEGAAFKKLILNYLDDLMQTKLGLELIMELIERNQPLMIKEGQGSDVHNTTEAFLKAQHFEKFEAATDAKLGQFRRKLDLAKKETQLKEKEEALKSDQLTKKIRERFEREVPVIQGEIETLRQEMEDRQKIIEQAESEGMEESEALVKEEKQKRLQEQPVGAFLTINTKNNSYKLPKEDQEKPWQTERIKYGFYHELVHAYHYSKGDETKKGEINGIDDKEWQVLGVGEHKTEKYSEVTIRRAMGKELREHYDGIVPP